MTEVVSLGQCRLKVESGKWEGEDDSETSKTTNQHSGQPDIGRNAWLG